MNKIFALIIYAIGALWTDKVQPAIAAVSSSVQTLTSNFNTFVSNTTNSLSGLTSDVNTAKTDISNLQSSVSTVSSTATSAQTVANQVNTQVTTLGQSYNAYVTQTDNTLGLHSNSIDAINGQISSITALQQLGTAPDVFQLTDDTSLSAIVAALKQQNAGSLSAVGKYAIIFKTANPSDAYTLDTSYTLNGTANVESESNVGNGDICIFSIAETNGVPVLAKIVKDYDAENLATVSASVQTVQDTVDSLNFDLQSLKSNFDTFLAGL